MKSLEPILTRTRPPGVYRLASRARSANILQALQAHGWTTFHIDGAQIHDKSSFLHVSAAALHFPAYFGNNWDAFEECLTDLEWSAEARYVILYDRVVHFARNAADEWQTAHSIFTDAIHYWEQESIAMYVLLRRTWWYARDVERL